MWCETHARPSRASANVFLSSAPTASSGGASATANVDGTYPRERRTIRPPRTTESSVRVWIGRSCSRNRSAIAASRSSASSSVNAIGSSDTFPLVITSGTPTSASSRWCSGEYGSITPRSRDRGATDGATRAPGRRGAMTIGARRRRVRPRPRRAPAASRAMSANGRSSRCLRARSRATAASSSARQARWNPPTPLTATIRPSSRPRDRLVVAAHARPARRARVRLGVEAAVARVVVLGLAGGAHDEAGHRRPRAVVRDAGDDREARAAVRAVDERVAIPPIGRVEELREAGVAGRDVRGDRRVRAPGARALPDHEVRASRPPERPRTPRIRRTPAAAPPTRRRSRNASTCAPSTSTSTPSASLSTNPASPCSHASP